MVDLATKNFPELTFKYCPDPSGLNMLFPVIIHPFDSVVCSEVIEHLREQDVENLIRNLYSITNQILVITTPVGSFESNPMHMRLYDEDMLNALFKPLISNPSHSFNIFSEDGFWYVVVDKRYKLTGDSNND